MGPILVTGGTGTLGMNVVRRLRESPVEPRVLSRKAAPVAPVGAVWMTGDLYSGQGLGRALEGVDTVVHCATDPAAMTHDLRSTANLITASMEAGVRHLVYISIVGVDRIPLRYYRTKYSVEQLIAESGIGHTILRTTQFHELIALIATYLEGPPVVAVPKGVSAQPISADEVAARLVRLSQDGPQGRVPDMGGPEIHGFRELVETHMAAVGRDRRIVEVAVPGAIAAAFKAGAHLAPEHRDGRQAWAEFLATRSDRPTG